MAKGQYPNNYIGQYTNDITTLTTIFILILKVVVVMVDLINTTLNPSSRW